MNDHYDRDFAIISRAFPVIPKLRVQGLRLPYTAVNRHCRRPSRNPCVHGRRSYLFRNNSLCTIAWTMLRTPYWLAFAVARLLARLGAIDTQFVEASLLGAEAYLAAAEPWTPEAAARECGIDASEIEAFASLLASTSPAMLRLGWGLERNRNGGSGCVGVLSMWALTGHFGVRGSGVIKSTSGSVPIDVGRLGPSALERHARSRISMNDVGLALHGESVPNGPMMLSCSF